MSMFRISSFKSIENKHDVYRGKDYKKNSLILGSHLQTNNRNHIKMQKIVIFAKKNLKINMLEIKNVVKSVTIIVITREHRGATSSVCNLKYSVPLVYISIALWILLLWI